MRAQRPAARRPAAAARAPWTEAEQGDEQGAAVCRLGVGRIAGA
jgi:hypothetical protein